MKYINILLAIILSLELLFAFVGTIILYFIVYKDYKESKEHGGNCVKEVVYIFIPSDSVYFGQCLSLRNVTIPKSILRLPQIVDKRADALLLKERKQHE